MNHKLKPEPQEKTNLQAVTLSQIICSKCGSDSYIKFGFNPSGKQKYRWKNCGAKFVPFARYCPHLVKGDDVWTAADLGLQAKPYDTSGDKLNFARNVQQDWLRIHIKKFIKYRASQTNSFHSLQCLLQKFKNFSQFLLSKQTVKKIEDINRQVIINYLAYLAQKQISQTYKSKCISVLAS